MSPIQVPQVVFDGIEAVRLSGLTNMLDRFAVAHLADEMGYPESATWLREHKELYARAVFRGFEAIP